MAAAAAATVVVAPILKKDIRINAQSHLEKSQNLIQKQRMAMQIFMKLKERKASPFSTGEAGTISEKLECEIDYYIKSPVADSECDPLEWRNVNSIRTFPYFSQNCKEISFDLCDKLPFGKAF